MKNQEKNNVVQLDNDARIVILYEELLNVALSRGLGLPVPTILGVLELLKDGIKSRALDE
jgi:hypothetical protein